MALLFKWVDGTNGNDGNDGNTEDTAYKTIEKAMYAGTNYTTIYVKQGVYWLNSQPTGTWAGAHCDLFALGQVIVKQPNAYLFSASISDNIGRVWHNFIFSNTGTLINCGISGGAAGLEYLNNCTVAQPQLVGVYNPLNPGCLAVNVTTPTGTKLDSPTSATALNVFYATGTKGSGTVSSYRCAPESGTYAGGSFINPSGLFPSLYGAYPILPKRIASLGLTKLYPANAYTGTVRSTTGSGCYAASPMQPTFQADDPGDTYALRANELIATSVSNTRYNIDYGSAVVAEGVYIVNGGGTTLATTNRGAKDFILQGSNSATAFAETTYATDTDWTDIGSGTFIQRSSTATQRAAQIVPIANSTGYRYYSVKLVNNLGGTTNIMVNKLLIAAKNTFSQCDQDTYKTGSTGTTFFPASSTGWTNDPDYLISGSATIDDYGITIGSGSTARVVSPVYEFWNQVNIRNIAMSGSEAADPSGTVIEYRIDTSSFVPSSTSPTWTAYPRNSDITASGTYLQYRFTLFVG